MEYDFNILGVRESALTSNIPQDSILMVQFSSDQFCTDSSDGTRNKGVSVYQQEDLSIKSRTNLTGDGIC